MFNKILVIHNEKKTGRRPDVLAGVVRILEDLGKDFLIVGLKDLKDNHFNSADLVIALGGDGTFIAASQFLNSTPILGINPDPLSSEGFFTNLKDNETEGLRDILDGRFKIIKRERASIKINGRLIGKHALCEVFVGAEKQFHTARYILRLRDQEEEHRSSGMVVVTGSGSTAWYKSLGGEPFHHEEKKLKFLVREPYVGERLFVPKMMNGEISSDEKISLESTRDFGGIVALDCNLIFPFNTGDKVEIILSDQPLNVVGRKNDN